MHVPAISVVMSAHNEERHICESVQSILDQTFSDFEFIIINDCSTDNTENLLREFTDERIVLIERQGKGNLAAALNLGLKVARGKYIARMDADDWSMPTRFAKQVDFMEQNLDVGVLGAQALMMNETLDKIDFIFGVKDKRDKITRLLAMSHPTVMLRISSLPAETKYNEKNSYAEDLELFLDLLPHTRMVNLPEPVLKKRHHATIDPTRTYIQKYNAIRANTQFIIDNLPEPVPNTHTEAIQWLLSPVFHSIMHGNFSNLDAVLKKMSPMTDSHITVGKLSALREYLNNKTLKIGAVGDEKIKLYPENLHKFFSECIQHRIQQIKFNPSEKIDIRTFVQFVRNKIKNKRKFNG